ncbi:hypothetical protein [Couchioplanes caeruleus]|nr:hypothetical protein [Couchioplanes caeruleus]ROP33452.1 hypothetical protein EDD30_6436 [Couchioplanes caeruleus]
MTAPVLADDVAWPIAVGLRTVIRAALADAVGGPPASCAVVPGRDVAIDDCCAGQAWVRIVRVYPTTAAEFPNPRGTAVGEGCDDGVFWAVELGAGSARCAPSADDYGNPPSDELLEDAARTLADDAARIRRAVLHDLRAAEAVDEVFVAEQSSVGPSGGCVGQEVLVAVLTVMCVDETG